MIEKALNVGLLAAQQGRLAQAVRLFNSELSGEYDLLSTHMEVLQEKLEKDNKFKTDLEEDVVKMQKQIKRLTRQVKQK